MINSNTLIVNFKLLALNLTYLIWMLYETVRVICQFFQLTEYVQYTALEIRFWWLFHEVVAYIITKWEPLFEKTDDSTGWAKRKTYARTRLSVMAQHIHCRRKPFKTFFTQTEVNTMFSVDGIHWHVYNVRTHTHAHTLRKMDVTLSLYACMRLLASRSTMRMVIDWVYLPSRMTTWRITLSNHSAITQSITHSLNQSVSLPFNHHSCTHVYFPVSRKKWSIVKFLARF